MSGDPSRAQGSTISAEGEIVMAIYDRICCAVDFSTPSRATLEEAAMLARALGAELTLVYVSASEGAPSAAARMLEAPPELFEEARAELERKLETWRAEAEKIVGRRVTAQLLSGDPASEIVRHAKEEACDLIVVGTHGRSGIAHLVLGSVAERVVRTAHGPVLVGRRGETVRPD